MNSIEYLIVSDTLDYASDYICYELKKRHANYLRLNRDKMSSYSIKYDVDEKTMYVSMDDNLYVICSECLQSIYFRAPVFLRSFKHYTIEQQLYRSQWSSFLRNLCVFKNVRWINRPDHIYYAENKILQLDVAKQVGFSIPKTFVANYCFEGIVDNKKYAVKALDTALFYGEDSEMFTYTSCINGKVLKTSELSDAPVIIQDYLDNKVDIRATVIGETVLAASITINGNGIEGDWRKNKKTELEYKKIELPENIKQQLVAFMRQFHLNFGGIDLALCGDKYYFVEVNPTGEWSWLEEKANLPISKTIVDYMEGVIEHH